MKLAKARQRIDRRLARTLCSLGYVVGIDPRSAPDSRLAARLAGWESRSGWTDIPRSRAAWESSWESGGWSHLDDLDELSRFSVIIGYLAHLGTNPAILDVGCGAGALYRRYRPYPFRRYLGLDISEVALQGARETQDERVSFVACDAENDLPDEQFDAIVFNECLYYFSDPPAVVDRYMGLLTADGIVIISIFTRSRRGRAILRAVEKRHPVMDETVITHGPKEWRITVLPRSSPRSGE
jgi:SAM-dependent methyltransferase